MPSILREKLRAVLAQAIHNKCSHSYCLLQRNVVTPITSMVLHVTPPTRQIESGQHPAMCGRMTASGTGRRITRLNGHMSEIAMGGETDAGA
jgi:hypothetical protein